MGDRAAVTGADRLLADRYRVLRRLGTGGMGQVFLCEDMRLARQVAVKRMEAPLDSELGRRVQREARIGAALSHPGLVMVYDTHADGDALLLVMEYVPGESLAARLERGPLEPDEALAVLRPVAGALDHAHGRGVIHRDVKPSNILVHERGGAKLADLGIAMAVDATRITRTGGLVGTLAYMAPEQLDAGAATPASDVYALAAVAFEALAGRRARAATSPFALLESVRRDPPPDLRNDLEGAPAEAADALRRGLALSPGDRPATAGELVGALEAAFAPAPGPPVPPPPAEEEPEPSPPPPSGRPSTWQSAAVDRRAAAGGRRITPPPAAPPEAGRGRRERLLVVLALAVVAAAFAAVVAFGLEDSEEPAGSGAGNTAREAPGAAGGAPETEAAPEGEAAAPETDAAPEPAPEEEPAPEPPAAGAAAPGEPAEAVRSFYERAAAGDLDGAWALAGPEMQAAFGGSRERFDAELGTLESIEFTRLETLDAGDAEARVALRSVARHTDRTDRCQGELRTVRGPEGGWLVEPRSVSCS